jgi:hypothetical protein
MNVNDMICVGAKPLSLVDYIAVDHVDATMLDAIGWSSSAIAAPTQMQRCMRCCSTSSSRSRRPSSPRRSSPVPCLAGLHERTRAIDLERRRFGLGDEANFDRGRTRQSIARTASVILASVSVPGSFPGERVLERVPGRRRAAGGADHVDEGAQAGRDLPVPRIIDEESFERRRPILQHADQLP